MDILTSRRSFLKLTAGALAGTFLDPAFSVHAKTTQAHPLSFLNLHTSERMTLTHVPGTSLPTDLQKKLDYFLRDFRTGGIHSIDNRLLDMVTTIQQQTRNQGVIKVVSGYRSPETNRALRKKSKGVAKKSFHMKGRALDIRIQGLPTRKLRDCAVGLKAGGVGYYPRSDFVHLDTGWVRCW